MSKITWLSINPKTGRTLIDQLWNRFDGLYPNKFRAQFIDQQAVDNWKFVWSECLADENITFDEIALALKACRRDLAWPPSFAEFYQACKPKVNHELEFIEAVRCLNLRRTGRDSGQWRSKASYWAASSLSFDIMNNSYAKIKTQWIQALDDKLADPNLPEIPEAPAYQLQHDTHASKQRSGSARDHYMQSMRDILKDKLQDSPQNNHMDRLKASFKPSSDDLTH